MDAILLSLTRKVSRSSLHYDRQCQSIFYSLIFQASLTSILGVFYSGALYSAILKFWFVFCFIFFLEHVLVIKGCYSSLKQQRIISEATSLKSKCWRVILLRLWLLPASGDPLFLAFPSLPLVTWPSALKNLNLCISSHPSSFFSPKDANRIGLTVC